MAEFGRARGVGGPRETSLVSSITSVGINDMVTQGQRNVIVALAWFETTIVTVFLDATACEIQSQAYGQVIIAVPMTLATGQYDLTVTGTAEGEEATRSVSYTQTHPLPAPAEGTTIPGSAANDPYRALIYGVDLTRSPYVMAGDLPDGLRFRSPHTAWTAQNIVLPLTSVVEADTGVSEGLTFSIPLSVLYDDAEISNSLVSVVSRINTPHILRLSSADGTALQPIDWTFPDGWIITPDMTLKLADVVVTSGETAITQSNVPDDIINDLTLGTLAVVILIDELNNLSAICPGIEVVAE